MRARETTRLLLSRMNGLPEIVRYSSTPSALKSARHNGFFSSTSFTAAVANVIVLSVSSTAGTTGATRVRSPSNSGSRRSSHAVVIRM